MGAAIFAANGVEITLDRVLFSNNTAARGTSLFELVDCRDV